MQVCGLFAFIWAFNDRNRSFTNTTEYLYLVRRLYMKNLNYFIYRMHCYIHFFLISINFKGNLQLNSTLKYFFFFLFKFRLNFFSSVLVDFVNCCQDLITIVYVCQSLLRYLYCTYVLIFRCLIAYVNLSTYCEFFFAIFCCCFLFVTVEIQKKSTDKA